MIRPIILVAKREYSENAKTKGFWISLLLFPIMILAGFTVPQLLESVKSERYIAVVDPYGDVSPIVDRTLSQMYARTLVKAIGEYAAENSANTEIPEIDLERTAPIDLQVDKVLDEVAAGASGAVEQLRSGPGLEALLSGVRGQLKDDAPEFEPPDPSYVRIELPVEVPEDATAAEIADTLKPYLRGEKTILYRGEEVELFAAVVVPDSLEKLTVRPGLLPNLPETEVDSASATSIQFWAANLADDELRQRLQRQLNDVVRKSEYQRASVDPLVVQRVEKTSARIVALNPKKAAGEEGVSLADQIRQWAPIGFVYLLWIGIFSISQMLLNNTIEEKSNRIIEVLLSSVTAGELMYGKLLGIAMIGLTMVGVWITSLIVIVALRSGPETAIATQLLEVLRTSGLLPAFVTYFLLGYLIYAGLFLAIGSVCNTIKDAQNLMGPIMLIMVVPMFTMFYIPKDPNGSLATFLSWIPIYTPFVMMNRAAADPPLFDLVGTVVMLLVTTALVLWGTGKIFRLGILRTGQPPKLLELIRWLR